MGLGVSAGTVAVLAGEHLEPVWQFIFGETRDLSRFTESTTSVAGCGLRNCAQLSGASGNRRGLRQWTHLRRCRMDRAGQPVAGDVCTRHLEQL